MRKDDGIAKETLRSMFQKHGSEQVNRALDEIEVRNALVGIVDEHGVEWVRESLREFESVERRPARYSRDSTSANGSSKSGKTRSRPRSTATEYVAKMTLQPEAATAVAELANRFEKKTFLPTFGYIDKFCGIYGIDVPASRSRASAIPRVFKFLASMDADDVQKLVDRRMFSGPSRLGPIADAIRRNGRAARARAAAGSRSDANEGA